MMLLADTGAPHTLLEAIGGLHVHDLEPVLPLPALLALLAGERPKPRAVVALLGHGGRRHEEALPSTLRALHLYKISTDGPRGMRSDKGGASFSMWGKGAAHRF